MSYMKPRLCADSRSAAQNIKRLFSQLGITTVKICSEVSEHHDQDAGSHRVNEDNLLHSRCSFQA